MLKSRPFVCLSFTWILNIAPSRAFMFQQLHKKQFRKSITSNVRLYVKREKPFSSACFVIPGIFKQSKAILIYIMFFKQKKISEIALIMSVKSNTLLSSTAYSLFVYVHSKFKCEFLFHLSFLPSFRQSFLPSCDFFHKTKHAERKKATRNLCFLE
jgi:hypothetical protein